MTHLKTLRGGAIAAALAVAALSAEAQGAGDTTTADDVQAEVTEAMNAIAGYTAQERDAAVSTARAGMDRLDAEIEQREQALRENWADLSEASRDTAQARLRDLRQTRDTLGERYGALQAGSDDAWNELKTGFSDAWTAFSDAWSAADDDASSGAN